MNNEKLIFDIVAGSQGSGGSRGDLSEALKEQGFFGKPKGTNEPETKRKEVKQKTLDKRDNLVTGNPIDIQDTFNKQNPD